MNCYQQSIVKHTNCNNSDVEEIENIMRNDIVHSTLDWLSANQFKKASIEAYQLFREIKLYNYASNKLFSKEYWQCSESELRQIELTLPLHRILLENPIIIN